MYIGFNQNLRSYAEGNTVAFSLNGSSDAAADASYPITNIWDQTSETTVRESNLLSKFYRLKDSSGLTGRELFIDIDLGTAFNVRGCILSGLQLAYGAVATDTITAIKLFSGSSSPASTLEVTLSDAASTASGDWANLLDPAFGPTVAIINTSETSERYWRVEIEYDADVSDTYEWILDIGNIALIGDGYDMQLDAPSVSYKSTDVANMGKTGTPFVINNGLYKIYNYQVPTDKPETTASVLDFLRHGDRRLVVARHRRINGDISEDLLNPAVVPVLGILASDVTNADADEQASMRNELSNLVLIDRTTTLTWQMPSKLSPQSSLVFREWA